MGEHDFNLNGEGPAFVEQPKTKASSATVAAPVRCSETKDMFVRIKPGQSKKRRGPAPGKLCIALLAGLLAVSPAFADTAPPSGVTAFPPTGNCGPGRLNVLAYPGGASSTVCLTLSEMMQGAACHIVGAVPGVYTLLCPAGEIMQGLIYEPAEWSDMADNHSTPEIPWIVCCKA